MTTGQPADPIFGYITGQLHPSQPPLIATYEHEGADAVAALCPTLDIRYGPHPRQTFDLFASTTARGTLLYLHAGYWQSRDKAQFRFIAPAFAAAGLNVALANYPLCPDVTIAALTDAVCSAVPAMAAQAGSAVPIVVAGHSAGGHLAVELALRDCGPAPPLAGIVALSGVYDLLPLIETPLNLNLRLDAASAASASPLNRVTPPLPPAVFAVGGLETAAFHDQTARMHRAWQASGASARLMVQDGADHFGILRRFTTPGPLFDAVLALFQI